MTEFAARERIEAIAETLGADVLHAAELSHLKSALNLLAAAKETHNKPLAAAMKTRIAERIKPLLSEKDGRQPAFDKNGNYFDLNGNWIG